MALDPSIFGMANRPTVALENPMDIAMKQLAMQQAQQQMETAKMDAQAKRDAMTRQANTRQAVAQSGGDLTKAIKAAMDAGDWETADKMTMALKAQQTANATFQKTVREMDEAKRKQTHADMSEFVRIANPLTKITDPAQFQAEASKVAAQFDPDGSKGWAGMAQNLTPATLKQMVDQTMDHKTWIEREFPKETKVPVTPHAGIGPDGKPGFFQLDENGKVPPGWRPMPNATAIMMSGAGGLTPEAKQMLVDKYIATGQLDSDISARVPGLRNEVINAAAEQTKGKANLAQNKLEFKTKGEAQKYFTTGKGADAFRQQETILHHAKVFEGIADALENGNVQLANKLGAEIGTRFTGTDKATNLKMAGAIFSAEVGKYLAGSQSTQSERQELAELMPVFNSPQQFKGGLKTLSNLVEGQRKSWQRQRDAALSGKVTTDETAHVKARPTATLANGSKVMLSEDGKRWEPIR